MTEYVCGFAFDAGAQRVALIQKKRPAWQAGKWNGIGGHVEPGETLHAAMVREFREEAGMDVDEWQEFLMLRSARHGWVVHFFRAFQVNLYHLQSVTDERVGWAHVDDVFNLDVIPNLRWLIPLAADHGWEPERGPFIRLVDRSGAGG